MRSPLPKIMNPKKRVLPSASAASASAPSGPATTVSTTPIATNEICVTQMGAARCQSFRNSSRAADTGARVYGPVPPKHGAPVR